MHMASDISITRLLFLHMRGEPVTGEERRSLLVRILDEATDANLDIVVHEDTPSAKPLSAAEYIDRAHFLGTKEFGNRIAYVPPPGFPPETCAFTSATIQYFDHAKLDEAPTWIAED